MLMAPGRERAEAGDAPAVGVDVGATAHIVPVRTAAAQDDEVEAVGLGVDALGSVLHNGKPPPSSGRVLREQHFGVTGQPVEPLVRVDDLATSRLVGLDPAGKGRVLQVAHADHAVGHAGGLAELAKDNAVLTTAPGIGRLFARCLGLDVLDGRGHKFAQGRLGNRALDGCNGLQPGFIGDALFPTQAHVLTAFLEAMTATTPLDSTVVRLPAVLRAGMPAMLP